MPSCARACVRIPRRPRAPEAAKRAAMEEVRRQTLARQIETEKQAPAEKSVGERARRDS